MATFVKRRVDGTLDEWCFTAKEEMNLLDTKLDLTVPPSLTDTSSSDRSSVLRRREPEHVHKDEYVRKPRRENADKYLPLLHLFWVVKGLLP